MDNSFVKTPEEVCQYFDVDSTLGLKANQVKEQQKKFGKNGKKKHVHQTRMCQC